LFGVGGIDSIFELVEDFSLGDPRSVPHPSEEVPLGTQEQMRVRIDVQDPAVSGWTISSALQ